jgi:hypothetical protein
VKIASVVLALSLALPSIGCEHLLGIGEPTLETDATPEPTSCDPIDEPITRQFVISALDAPSTADESEAAAFDLDGDGNVDNQLFSALSSLAGVEPELDLQPTIDESLSAGLLIQLLEANLGKGCATTLLYEGEDRDVPVNPSDNFSGEESFRVIGTARGSMLGVHVDGTVLAGDGGVAELRLPLFRDTEPIELPLVAARVRYVVTPNGMIDGAIGGAIRADVVDGLVIPSFTASLQTVVARDCFGSTWPDCCNVGSTGGTVLGAFDANRDCELAIEEVRGASITQSFLGPDVDLYNGGVLQPNVDGVLDAVSVGIPFTAVNAFFLTSAAARQ